MRTIDAPGIEIKEIDKSGYAPAMTGTKCYVMGYSDKGTPYEPMEFTSKAAWQSFYGDPDNEAERYFYNACSEVMNQNGVLYCARLPYDNDAKDKMVAFKYTVNQTDLKPISSSQEIISEKVKTTSIKNNENFEKAALSYWMNKYLYRKIQGDGADSEKIYDETIKDFVKGYRATDDWEVRNFYDKFVEKLDSLKDTGKSQTKDGYYVDQYMLQYYTAKKGAEETIHKTFISQKEAENFMSSFQDIEGECVYHFSYGYEKDETVSSFELSNNDWEVIGIKYVYDDDVFKNRGLTDQAEYSHDEILSVLKERQQEWNNDGEISVWNATGKCFKFERTFGMNTSCDIDDSDDVHEKHNHTFVPKISRSGTNYEMAFTMSPKEICDLSDFKDELTPYLKVMYKDYQDMKLIDIINNCRASIGETTFADMYKLMEDYKNNITSIATLVNEYKYDYNLIRPYCKYHSLKDVDNTIDNYIEITHGSEPYACDLTAIDEYNSGENVVPNGTFLIVDKTCATLNKIMEDERKADKRELIGIFPVVTTAANAMYAQSLIDVQDYEVTDYESVTNALTKDLPDTENGQQLLSSDIVKQFSNNIPTADGSIRSTVSREANEFFSAIQMNPEMTGFDTENLKKIGVVVYKAYMDASEGNKISFTPVESFVGSLNKDAKNPNTGTSTFIDKIVNSNSNYIYFFSNCFGTTASKTKFDKADVFIINPGVTGMLGFFSKETAETISLSSIYDGMEKCFTKAQDINERDIDIIPDAGIANIAQYMKSVYGGSGAWAYDLDAVDDNGNPQVNLWKCQSKDDIDAWKTVIFKYDNFCKNIRKDCMFIADGPRPLVLQGQKKIIRSSKPSNTIDANILPYVKYVTGINTNYGAGYLDWFQIADEFTGDNFWCPPSIKAMGVYINTDVNFNYWDAPAGLNRGVIAALDTAFSPTMKQAGSIYTKNWNYAINYPYDGIVLEGQKTFQVKPSALDRVNVRRLMLRLERQTFKVLRYIVYEGNTAYLRQRTVDLITPYFEQAKNGGGLYDFKIQCDDKNNTPTTIDNNELHIAIGIKPTKTVEFILVDFILASTGASWSEVM